MTLNLAFIIAAIILVGAIGTTLPTFISIYMEQNGFSSTSIGYVHTAQYVAGLIVGLVMPAIISRLGLVYSFIACVIVSIITINLHRYATSVPEMIPLRFILGICFGSFYAIAECWINGIAEEKNRAKIASIYCTILVGGFSAGSWILNHVPNTPTFIFGMCSIAYAAAILPVFFARLSAPEFKIHARFNPFKAITLVPVVIITTAFYGFIENAIITLLPVYGLKMGLEKEVTVNMISVFMAGGMLMLLPMGALADKINRQKMLMVMLLFSVAISAMLHFVILNKVLLYVVMFAWGSIMIPIYPILMSILGQNAPGEKLAQATTGMVMMYGIGSAFGPTSIGYAMDYTGPVGFPAVVSITILISLMLAAYISLRGRKQITPPE